MAKKITPVLHMSTDCGCPTDEAPRHFLFEGRGGGGIVDGSKHVTFSGARINSESRREMSSNSIVHHSVSGLGEASPVRGVFTAGSVSS